ncbi:mucin-associated surface protein (MASP), putative, partial [Trypanosoma cruzi marinkellei]
ECEDDDDGDGDDDEDEGKEDEERRRGQSGEGGTFAAVSDSTEAVLIDSEQQTEQSIVSTGSISLSGRPESNAVLKKKEVASKKATEKNPPAVETVLTTGDGGKTLSAGIVGGNPPSPPKDGVNFRKQDGEVTTSEGNKTVPSPGTAATPQSHHDNVTEETGEDTKATTVIVNTNDTRNTQNSVSSPEAAKAVEPGAGMESNPTNNNSSPPSTGVATQLTTTPNAKGPSDIKDNQNSRSAGNATATVATAAQTNGTSKSGDSDS